MGRKIEAQIFVNLIDFGKNSLTHVDVKGGTLELSYLLHKAFKNEPEFLELIKSAIKHHELFEARNIEVSPQKVSPSWFTKFFSKNQTDE